jgi:predicted naringenin-chalcone synthase
MAIVLRDFSLATPRVRVAQGESLDWLARGFARASAAHHDEQAAEANVRRQLGRYGASPARIGFRHFEVPDAAHGDFDNMLIHRVRRGAPEGAPINERMDFYKEAVLGRLRELYASVEDAHRPEHLLHVTCTGYVSPSPGQIFVAERGWQEHTAVTHTYHMGCYAALPAVRLADGLAHRLHADGPHRGIVDVFHSELCSLHGNLSASTPEQMVVQSLFADGFIKYRVVHADADDAPSPHRRLLLLGIREQIVPDTTDHMTWKPYPWGMHMTLARGVPDAIRGALPDFLGRLAKSAGVTPAHLIDGAAWAVHPGGPRIVDQVSECLRLRDEQIAASRQVLFERGNMSSATIPHIWKHLAETLEPGRLVVSLAFGPGLTLFGSLMRTVK